MVALLCGSNYHPPELKPVLAETLDAALKRRSSTSPRGLMAISHTTLRLLPFMIRRQRCAVLLDCAQNDRGSKDSLSVTRW